MYRYLSDFLVNCLQNNLNLMYAQVVKDGRVVEEWKRMPVKTRLNAWSVSKGVVACAAGIAESEGLIRLDEKIADIYPEYAALNSSPYLKEVTLRHMLTMTSGLKSPLFFCDGPDRYITHDWIRYFFEKGEFANRPGTAFLYSNFNTYMVSCVIEKRAGQNLLEYLRYRLFEPMGMHNPDWTLCPMGHVHAANGLYFTLDELSSLGGLILNEGSAKGQQLVPRAFMKEALSPKVSLKGSGFGAGNSTDDYGYYFMMDGDRRSFHLSGNYGQGCWAFPEENTVVSYMSLEGNFREIERFFWENTAQAILAK